MSWINSVTNSVEKNQHICVVTIIFVRLPHITH
jgi:hypothetical protein